MRPLYKRKTLVAQAFIEDRNVQCFKVHAISHQVSKQNFKTCDISTIFY